MEMTHEKPVYSVREALRLTKLEPKLEKYAKSRRKLKISNSLCDWPELASEIVSVVIFASNPKN